MSGSTPILHASLARAGNVSCVTEIQWSKCDPSRLAHVLVGQFTLSNQEETSTMISLRRSVVLFTLTVLGTLAASCSDVITDPTAARPASSYAASRGAT